MEPEQQDFFYDTYLEIIFQNGQFAGARTVFEARRLVETVGEPVQTIKLVTVYKAPINLEELLDHSKMEKNERITHGVPEWLQ